MRHVLLFVAVTEPDTLAESILHDAEVILMIHDVGRELGAVAPADDALLAGAGGLPVHFQLELVCLDETGRLGQARTECAEEEEKAMRLSAVIVERAVGGGADAPENGAVGERARLGRVPLLRAGRDGEREEQQRQRRVPHARQATRRLVTAACVALLAGCGGGSTGPDNGVPRTALLALARVDSAEPTSPAVCTFHNNQLTTCTILHNDSVHTLFASVTFAPHSIVSRNDTLLCDTCTINVALTLTPGSYQLDVGPASLVFNETGEPVATVSFGLYGDPSVYTQSSRYASAAAFEDSLELWRERTPDHWVEGRNTRHSGQTVITSALESPGSYLVAALK